MTTEEAEKTANGMLFEDGKRLLTWAAKMIALGYVIISVIGWLSGSYDRDDTDGEARSGMEAHTDNLTGCQYLSTRHGGITPRMKNGRHLGCHSI